MWLSFSIWRFDELGDLKAGNVIYANVKEYFKKILNCFWVLRKSIFKICQNRLKISTVTEITYSTDMIDTSPRRLLKYKGYIYIFGKLEGSICA